MECRLTISQPAAEDMGVEHNGCWLTISRQAAEDMGVEHNGMPAYGKPASSSRVDMGVEHSGMLAYNKPASSRGWSIWNAGLQ